METKILNINIDEYSRMLFISDVHADLLLFKEALKNSNFNDKDYLFVLGDVIEKGNDCLESLRYIMELSKQNNVFFVKGNCEDIINDLKNMTDSKLFHHYALTKKNTIFLDMANEMNIEITSKTDVRDFYTLIEKNFQREIEYLENLPHVIIVNETLYLAHAGIDDIYNISKNPKDIMKNDSFLTKYNGFDKFQIVGHFPTRNYQVILPTSAPIIDMQKKVISIDGGNNVALCGVINVLKIDSLKQFNISYKEYNHFPKAKVKKDVLEDNLHLFNITFYESDVNVLEELDDFYKLIHFKTRQEFYAPKNFVFRFSDHYKCYDGTNHILNVKKGDFVGIVYKGKNYSMAICNGLYGIIKNDCLELRDYFKVDVNHNFEGMSIDDFLNYFYLGKSRKHEIKKHFYVNDSPYEPNYLFKNGDKIEIDLTSIENRDFLSEDKPIDIVFEDDYFLFVNKAKNMIIHPDTLDKTGTLVNCIAAYYEKNNINRQIRYLHRIDIDTTGIVMIAKDILTQTYMNHFIETHDIKRTYLAITENKFNHLSGTINKKIGEDRHHNSRRRISKTGKIAITHYEVINSLTNGLSLVKLNLETGRTHQIRVHMSSINHPLAGDELYGGSKRFINRCALHSYGVEFMHPIYKKLIKVTCKLPCDMKEIVGDLDD